MTGVLSARNCTAISDSRIIRSGSLRRARLAPGCAGQCETRDSSGAGPAQPPGHRVQRVAAGEHVVKNHDELAPYYRGVGHNQDVVQLACRSAALVVATILVVWAVLTITGGSMRNG